WLAASTKSEGGARALLWAGRALLAGASADDAGASERDSALFIALLERAEGVGSKKGAAPAPAGRGTSLVRGKKLGSEAEAAFERAMTLDEKSAFVRVEFAEALGDANEARRTKLLDEARALEGGVPLFTALAKRRTERAQGQVRKE